jgi:hypothetical protein
MVKEIVAVAVVVDDVDAIDDDDDDDADMRFGRLPVDLTMMELVDTVGPTISP